MTNADPTNLVTVTAGNAQLVLTGPRPSTEALDELERWIDGGIPSDVRGGVPEMLQLTSVMDAAFNGVVGNSAYALFPLAAAYLTSRFRRPVTVPTLTAAEITDLVVGQAKRQFPTAEQVQVPAVERAADQSWRAEASLRLDGARRTLRVTVSADLQVIYSRLQPVESAT